MLPSVFKYHDKRKFCYILIILYYTLYAAQGNFSSLNAAQASQKGFLDTHSSDPRCVWHTYIGAVASREQELGKRFETPKDSPDRFSDKIGDRRSLINAQSICESEISLTLAWKSAESIR